MAKAREIPGLRPDTPFARAAGRTVRVRARELIDHADGVLDTSDIERVHAMRVASRRLRAVLEIHVACFPPDAYKPILSDVKALADALGARRDPDVQLLALRAFADAVGDAERPGVDVFVAQLEQEQEEGNAVLAEELERMTSTRLGDRLAALADLVDPPEPQVEAEVPDGSDEAVPDDAGVEPETDIDLAEGADVAVEAEPDLVPDADRPVDDDDHDAGTEVAVVTPEVVTPEVAAPASAPDRGGRWPGGWGSKA